VAAVVGAFSLLGHPQHVRSVAAYVGMAILEVVGGAFAMAFGMAAIESHTTGEPFEPLVVVLGGVVGLFAFGLPALVATGTHVTIWRSLLVPAVDGATPTPDPVVAAPQPV
jgi:hypothetical protein